MAHEKKQLEAMTDAELLKILHTLNPLGGYSIGKRKGQLSRQAVIDTILRYES